MTVYLSVPRQRQRAALRAAGLRPVVIWVPDTRRAGFAEECRRQSLSLCNDEHEDKTLEQLAAVSDNNDWQ